MRVAYNFLLQNNFGLICRFLVVETGPKILYLNTSIRGYPHGLRAGKDPRKPMITIDAGFEKVRKK